MKELTRLKATAKELPQMPRVSMRLLKWVLPFDEYEIVFGDLLEEFRTRVAPEAGDHAAHTWLRWQILTSLVPLLRTRLARMRGGGARQGSWNMKNTVWLLVAFSVVLAAIMIGSAVVLRGTAYKDWIVSSLAFAWFTGYAILLQKASRDGVSCCMPWRRSG